MTGVGEFQILRPSRPLDRVVTMKHRALGYSGDHGGAYATGCAHSSPSRGAIEFGNPSRESSEAARARSLSMVAAFPLWRRRSKEVRVVLKYRHSDGNLCIKVTDDVLCLLYRTDQAQDVKKIEKFHSQLMRLMVTKESRSVAMETN